MRLLRTHTVCTERTAVRVLVTCFVAIIQMDLISYVLHKRLRCADRFRQHVYLSLLIRSFPYTYSLYRFHFECICWFFLFAIAINIIVFFFYFFTSYAQNTLFDRKWASFSIALRYIISKYQILYRSNYYDKQ